MWLKMRFVFIYVELLSYVKVWQASTAAQVECSYVYLCNQKSCSQLNENIRVQLKVDLHLISRRFNYMFMKGA
jgi:hypothetical protein